MKFKEKQFVIWIDEEFVVRSGQISRVYDWGVTLVRPPNVTTPRVALEFGKFYPDRAITNAVLHDVARMQKESAQRLKEINEWLKKPGQAISGGQKSDLHGKVHTAGNVSH